MSPNRRFSIKHLIIVMSIAAALASVCKIELTELDPSISINLLRSQDADTIYVELKSSSLRPLWIQGSDGYVSNYRYRVFGSSVVDDGVPYGTGLAGDWVRVSEVRATRLQLPRGTKRVQIEITVFDWRGRYVRFWSPFLEL